jgi:hypothetical protein
VHRAYAGRIRDRLDRELSDGGMVDLFAVRLPAVFAAHLLPPVRALQSRRMAVACFGDT